VANPGQTQSSNFYQNPANGLKKLKFIRGVNQRMVALVKSLQDPVQPAQLSLAGKDRFFGLHWSLFTCIRAALSERSSDEAVHYPMSTRPRPEAIAMASVRPIAFSFFKIDFTWFFTVYSLI